MPGRVRKRRGVVGGVGVQVVAGGARRSGLDRVDRGEASDCWVVLACLQMQQPSGVELFASKAKTVGVAGEW